MTLYQCHFCGGWLDADRHGEPKGIKVNEEPPPGMGVGAVSRFRLICPTCLQQLAADGHLPSRDERPRQRGGALPSKPS